MYILHKSDFFFKATSPNPHQNKERHLLLHLETEFLKTHKLPFY